MNLPPGYLEIQDEVISRLRASLSLIQISISNNIIAEILKLFESWLNSDGC
jgi:hypothetical protein